MENVFNEGKCIYNWHDLCVGMIVCEARVKRMRGRECGKTLEEENDREKGFFVELSRMERFSTKVSLARKPKDKNLNM